MNIALISGLKKLGSPPRRFLIYVAINVVSWQNIVGPAMVLLARKIDMPESLVGLLIAFMPFTSMLLLFTLPLIVRQGPKRVMLWAWFLRNVIACIVFLLPVALAMGSKKGAWAILIFTIFGFCVMRAIGAGGWLPWLHEIVPTPLRATYFSAETSITQIINVGVLFLQARLLAVEDPGIYRFLLIFGIGIFMGFVSLFWMQRVPGGAGTQEVEPHIGVRAYGRALRDKQYRHFLIITTFSLSGIVWFNATNVLYLRDCLAVRDSMTMTITALGGLGVLLTVGSWARFTDKSGSGLAMAKTLFGHTCAPALLLLSNITAPDSTWPATVAIILACIFTAAFGVAINRAMLNQVPDQDRVGYTAIWTVFTSLAHAITPVVAGILIEHFGIWGYRSCFILSMVSTLIGALLSLFFIHDLTLEGRSWVHLLNPVLPLRTAGRVLWITMGLDASNRETP
ncbi:MAG: MFS transporter [Candidatus Hydrogenedentales bacterium]|jgi:hypothetical protein